MFETTVRFFFDSEAPMVARVRNPKNKCWIKSETKLLMRERDSARDKAAGSQMNCDWINFRKLRNQCSVAARRDKKQYYKELFQRHENGKDITNLYRKVKYQLGWNSGGPTHSLVSDGKLTSSSKKMADIMMNYFHQKVLKLTEKLPRDNEDPTKELKEAIRKWGRKAELRPVGEFRIITLTETMKILQTLGNGGLFGFDEIDAILLKMVSKSVIKPLQYIINLSLSSSKFANRWRIGHVIPLHKGKQLEKTKSSSYRPISLLPLISKLVERAAQMQVLEFMEKTKQMNGNNAYRKLYSTAIAVIQILDAIHEATDENTIANVLTIDESAVFNTISHEILDDKLKLYNMGVKMRKWFQNYLGHRTQYVSIGSKKSEMKYVKQGVPQGSVIGPLLYTIYINELPSLLEDDRNCMEEVHNEDSEYLFPTNCRRCGLVPCFADDGTIITASNSRPENQTRLRKNIDTMKKFLSKNKLTMNEDKTTLVEVMVPQKRVRVQGNPPYLDTRDNNGELKRVIAAKYTRILGYNLQENLTMNSHLESGEKCLLGQLRQKLGAIKHIGQLMPPNCRKTLATGLLLSRIQYMIQIWGGAPQIISRKSKVS